MTEIHLPLLNNALRIAFLVLSLAVLRQEVLGASNVACEGYQCKNECVTAGCGKNCKGQECAKMCAANNCGQNCYGECLQRSL